MYNRMRKQRVKARVAIMGERGKMVERRKRVDRRKRVGRKMVVLSYGPPWAHCLGGYQDRLLSGPLGLLGLCHTTPDGVGRKDYGGEVLG
jgi:hypothetical protein